MNYEAAIDLQKQLAFIAALLAGFSITFFIGLMQLKIKKLKSIFNACLGSVGFSSCALILSTITSISGAYWLTERPGLSTAETTLNMPEIDYAFDWSALSFVLGLVCLLIGIGLCGRLHSKRMGIITLVFSITTILLIFFFWSFLVKVN